MASALAAQIRSAVAVRYRTATRLTVAVPRQRENCRRVATARRMQASMPDRTLTDRKLVVMPGRMQAFARPVQMVRRRRSCQAGTVHQKQALLARMLMAAQRQCHRALKAGQSLLSWRPVVKVHQMQVSVEQRLTVGRIWRHRRAAMVDQMLCFHPAYQILTWCCWVAMVLQRQSRRWMIQKADQIHYQTLVEQRRA